MKSKLFLAILSLLIFTGVIFATNEQLIKFRLIGTIDKVNISIVDIKGHEYILTSGTNCVSIIHSESCNCKINK